MDKRIVIARALVDEVEVTVDRSKARALVRILPDETEAIAEVCWDGTGPSAGGFQLPVKGDLVLVATDSADGEVYIIGRLSSNEDKIPADVANGHRVIRGLAGKDVIVSAPANLQLIGNGLVYLGGGEYPGIYPDQPGVLGTVLVSLFTDIFTKLDSIIDTLKTAPTGVDSVGGQVIPHPTLVATLTATKAEMATMKAFYLDSAASGILSERVFIER